MKIVKIVRKDEKNVVVHFDNDEVLFLSNEIFLKNGLRKNDEISEGLFSSLLKENQLFHIKQKAFRYLGRRLHSENELKIKLRQKGYDKLLIESVLQELSQNNYLNDYDFASQFSDENIKNKKWGSSRIETELLKRGIPREIISKIIEEKFPEGNNMQNALLLAKKKMEILSARNTDEQKLRLKLTSFLAGRGYDFETIREAIDDVLKKDN